MPRLLIKDAHEWTNEIPSVPTYYLAKGVVIGGRFTNNEIPLLLSSLYLSNDGGTAAASSEVRVSDS